MSLYLGSEIKGVYCGNAEVKEAYVGSHKVWGNSATPYIMMLMNGFTETHSPTTGSIAGSAVRSTSCPIQCSGGMLVYDCAKISSSTNANFKSGDFIQHIKSGKPFTYDFWFSLYGNTGGMYAGGLYTNDDGVVNLFFGNTYFNTSTNNSNFGLNVNKNDWHHTALTKEEGASIIKLYIDGTLKSSLNSTNYSSFEMFRMRRVPGLFLAQIALRSKVVWTENFTPPTNVYTA